MKKIFKLRSKLPLYCLALCIFMLSSSAFSANHALLIGIQNYPKSPEMVRRELAQLSGPQNDVKLIGELLTSPPFTFPKKNITVLLDKQATHAGINKAFADLKKRVKPDDFVYIHFSGHGSEAVNDNPDVDIESSIDKGKSMDQTWVSYGASSGLSPKESKDMNDWDILDDEVNLWLNSLGTEHIILVSDSCHSGSVSRGTKIGVRGISMDSRDRPKVPSLPNIPPIGIRIGASGDQESAFEYKADPSDQNAKSYGRFTWFWAQALKQLKPGETWGDIFQRTKILMSEQTMEGRRVNQSPQIEPQNLGGRDMQVVSGDFAPHAHGIMVAAVDKQTIKLSDGLLSGVTKGSIYKLFSNDKTAQSVEAEVTETSPFSSKGQVLNGVMKQGDLLVEKHHAYSFKPIKVVLEGDFLKGQDKQLAAKIIEKLKARFTQNDADSEFKLVNNRTDADWIIYLFHPERHDGNYLFSPNTTLPNSIPSNPPEAWVLDTKEVLLDDTLRTDLSNADKDIDTLIKKLNIMLDMRELIQVENKGNKVPEFSVKAHQLAATDNCQESEDNCFKLDENGGVKSYRAIDSTELSALDQHNLTPGTKMGFSVENSSSTDYYLYLINISARDGAYAHFPPSNRTPEFAKVTRGKQKLPGAIYFENPGREIIKAVLSQEELDPRAFEFAGTVQREASKGASSPLERLLNRNARRGKPIPAPEPSAWGTMQAEMLVK